MRKDWDAGRGIQPLWCWRVTEGSGDQDWHLVDKVTLPWGATAPRDVSAHLLLPEAGPTSRLLLPPSQLLLYTNLSHTVPPFLSLALKLSFSQIPVFFTKSKKI